MPTNEETVFQGLIGTRRDLDYLTGVKIGILVCNYFKGIAHYKDPQGYKDRMEKLFERIDSTMDEIRKGEF